MADPFSILGLEPSYDIDDKALAERHRTLSATLHPDRYVGKPAAERRMALDRAIEVNAAYRRLRDPVRRAEAFLQTIGIEVGDGAEPKASPALLMEMMEVREALAEAKAEADLDRVGRLSDEMKTKERSLLIRLSDKLAGTVEGAAVLPLLGELRYVRRFFEEVEAIEEQMMS
ncbi:MAG: Fe-S protein assembly co-chaperone HscB [Myxococcota bacterium]